MEIPGFLFVCFLLGMFALAMFLPSEKECGVESAQGGGIQDVCYDAAPGNR